MNGGIRWRPTAREERLVELRERLGDWEEAHLLTPGGREIAELYTETGWRSSRMLWRMALALFAIFGVASFAGLSRTLISVDTLLTGIVSLTLAELLIVRGRYFRNGVEEALCIAGVLAMIFSLDGNSNAGVLLVSAGTGLAAWRVLNPLLAILALGALDIYVGLEIDVSTAGWTALLIASCAALAVTRAVRRPFHQHTLWGAQVVFPIVAYLCFLFSPGGYLLPHFSATSLTMTELAGFIVLIVTGFGFFFYRHLTESLHLALIAGGIVAIDIGFRLELSHEVKLITAGVGLIGTARIVDRALRNRTTGIVSRPLAGTADHTMEEAIAAGLILPTTEVSDPEHERQGGGGEFGGGGATSDF